MRQWRPVRRSRKAKRQLTHEEMLEEAKWTELENLASLEAYTRTMAEKKKVKTKKVGFHGPVVRYLSVAMPLVQDADGSDEVEKDGEKEKRLKEGEEKEGGEKRQNGGELEEEKRKKEGEGEKGEADTVIPMDSLKDSQDSGIGATSASESIPVAMETNTDDTTNRVDTTNLTPDAAAPISPISKPPSPPAKQSRNFMIFTDTNNFPSAYFPRAKRTRPRRKLCPVTGLPAKYMDPLTRTPYATPFAFKVIRMRYVSEAEEKCEKRLIQLSNWLEEKKKKKMEIT